MRYTHLFAIMFFVIVSSSCQNDPATVSDQPFLPGGGTVRLAGLGDCAGSPGSALAGEAASGLTATVRDDGTVSFVHNGAVFNCCMDSVGLEMYSWGSILRVLEREHCAEPCRCTCEYSVHGELGDLEPGYYTLEVCVDSLGIDVLCSVQFQIGG